MSENEGKPPTQIKNSQVLAFLIILLGSLAAGGWLLWQAANAKLGGTPPLVAFIAIFIAVLALLDGRQARQAATESPPALAILGFAWVYTLARYWRRIAFVGAIMATVYVLWRIPRIPPDGSYAGVVFAWGTAFCLYALALTRQEWAPVDWRAWWQRHRWLATAVGGIVLLALVLRVWRIGTLPFTLAGDEGSQGLEAIRTIAGEIRNPFSTGWLGVPTMSFFFNSIPIRLLGRTTTALRLPWALVGTATILVTFFLVKQLKGTRLALVTAVLLATYHYHIHFSRLGSNQIADPFFLALALLFLHRALDRESRLDWVITGAVCGLAFYFYAGARLTPVVLLAVLGYGLVWEPRRFLRKHSVGFLIALGAFLVVAAPMIQYAVQSPDSFNARLNQVGIIQSGWLEREVEIRGQSKAVILFDQFRRAALAFNFYPDRTTWYGLRKPFLDPFFGSLFLLGLGYSTLRLLGRDADKRLAPMVVWWWSGMILGGMMTESPPSSQRLVTLTVPTCFLMAVASWELIQLARQAIAGVRANSLLVLGVVLFAISSLSTYFLVYTPQRIYGGPNAEMATEIAPLLNELSLDHRFYFVGAPWMYWGFATLPYLAPDADAVDVFEPITAAAVSDLVLPGKGAAFIFLPQREAELKFVEQAFPDGRRLEVRSPVDGRLMAELYITPR